MFYDETHKLPKVIVTSYKLLYRSQSVKGEGRLVRKGFFGVGKWKKDRISKLRLYITEVACQYTFKMHLKVILKGNFQVISCCALHNITYCLKPAELKSWEPSSGLSFSKNNAKLLAWLHQDSNSCPLGLQASALSIRPAWHLLYTSNKSSLEHL